MIKVTIYERYIENVGDVKGYLRQFANTNNIIIKENVFFKAEDMINTITDVCLIDYKAFLEYSEELIDWQTNHNIKFIFATSDIKDIIEIM